MSRKGTISVETSDILPIIKKWLYSEHDIFIRELVANATDAITKRKTLSLSSNQSIPEGKITIELDKNKKLIRVIDNGLGMTEEEIEKYIAQLAFSGAKEFVEKLEKEGHKQENSDIIGKFGLGFYSSFMVADKVEIDSLSSAQDAKPSRWICDGSTQYTFETSTQSEVGTVINLHINQQGMEFLDKWKMTGTLEKFCNFMPYPIEVIDITEKDAQAQVINDTNPLWKQKDVSELTDKDYIDFYNKLFPMGGEPLFWLHLKVDHPFTLEGILYFPKVDPKISWERNNIRLYCRQMFVSDNVKSVIPDFLSMLKGVIDSPDIPLNVSRSSLQGDPNVGKISNYVVRKVAESLKKLFKTNRTRYEEIWDNISLFVKYGAVSETKFDELVRDFLIFRDSKNKFCTLDEYRTNIPKDFTEKMKDKVIYFDKKNSDPSLRSQLASKGIEAIEIDDHIDPHLLQHIETKKIGDKVYQFSSVDAEIANLLEIESADSSDTQVKELFQKYLSKDEDKKEENKTLDIETKKIKDVQTAAYFKIDEQMKRLAQMTKGMGGNNTFPIKRTLVINTNSDLVCNALKLHKKGKGELTEKLCHHIEDLATLSSEGLPAEQKELFVQRSQDLIKELTTLAL